jgi:hypothetical protein
MKTSNSSLILASLLLTTLLVCCNKNDSVSPRTPVYSDNETTDATIDTSSLRRGLVAFYPFKGDILDHSGNGHDGTVVGTISYGLNHKGEKIQL